MKRDALRWLVAPVVAWLALGSAMSGPVSAQGRPQIQNYNAPGNLESKFDLGCIELKDASPNYNPVDLDKAIKACLTGNKFDEAARLAGLAGVYGRYDTLRVADPTAHQAVIVARMEIIGELPESDSAKFTAAIKSILGDPQKLSSYCQDIRKIGPPSYLPRYMIQHGMNAFLAPGGDGLVKNFDSSAAWTSAMTTYLHCTTQ